MELRSRSLPPPMERERPQTPNHSTTEMPISQRNTRRSRSPSPVEFGRNRDTGWFQNLEQPHISHDKDFEEELGHFLDHSPLERPQNPHLRERGRPLTRGINPGKDTGLSDRNCSPPRGIQNHSQLSRRWGNSDYLDRPYVPQRRAFREPTYSPDRNRYNQVGYVDEPTRVSSRVRPVQPIFDGNNCSWDSFLLQLRLLARTYRWNADDFHTQLVLSLKGKALSYITSLQHRTQENTDALLAALEKRFGRNKLAETQRATLSSLRKNPKDTWQEYCARVDELMSEAYPGMQGTDIYSGLAIENFLRGVPDRKLAYEVQLRKPRDLTEAVDMIMWHEACKQSSFRNTDVRFVEEMDETEFDSESEMAEMRRVNQRRKSGYDKKSSDMRRIDDHPTMEEKLKKLFREFEAIVGNPSPNSSQSDRTNRRPWSKEPTCYRCGKTGHIAPNCPENPNNRHKLSSRDNSVDRKPEAPENRNGLC